MNINTITFKAKNTPQRLDNILINKKIGEKSFDIKDVFIKNIAKSEEIASTKIVDFIGNGASAYAFETEDGKILKLSHGSHYHFARPQENFDVPIYKQGKVGNIYYYFEEKLMQHGMTEGFVEIMREMIKEKNYRINDLGSNDIHQIGLSTKGTLHLVDPECARFKTIFHALWQKAKTLFSSKLSSSRFSKALHK